MPSIKEILTEQANRLTDIPDKFLTATQRAEKELLAELIELLGTLETKNGQFVPSTKNLRITNEIVERMRRVFTTGEYGKAVAEFASQFDEQAVTNTLYFEQAFDEFKIPELAITAVERARNNAVNLLMNSEATASFFAPLRDILEEAIINGARYKDVLETLEPLFSGKDGGKIKTYSSQIAYDAFAIADAEYINLVAKELNIKWRYYSGGEVATTRPFCSERTEKYFYYLEIEGWPEGKKQPGQRSPDSSGNWEGKIPGTSDKTIYAYRGGYNCRHRMVGVSIRVVPKDVIQRNIQNGNFTPSEFEKRELGL